MFTYICTYIYTCIQTRERLRHVCIYTDQPTDAQPGVGSQQLGEVLLIDGRHAGQTGRTARHQKVGRLDRTSHRARNELMEWAFCITKKNTTRILKTKNKF